MSSSKIQLCRAANHKINQTKFGPKKKYTREDCVDCSRSKYDKLKAAGLCIRCGGRRNDRFLKCYDCRELARQLRDKIRLNVIIAYGGRCACCNEDNHGFLTIDHVFNDGAAERRKSSKRGIYRKLTKDGFPKDRYQLLCYNCNMGRQNAGGLDKVCPHKW